MNFKSRARQSIYALVVLFLSAGPINGFSQTGPPYPCDDALRCSNKCQADGFTCWDIDDGVPLDNGLLFLVGGAVAFGLYRLNMRREQA